MFESDSDLNKSRDVRLNLLKSDMSIFARVFVSRPKILEVKNANHTNLTSKRRTDLKICVPEAKFIKESDFDVKTYLPSPKSSENEEKRVFLLYQAENLCTRSKIHQRIRFSRQNSPIYSKIHRK